MLYWLSRPCWHTHHSHKRKESVSMTIPQQLELTTQWEYATGSRQKHRLPELHLLRPVLGKCLVDLQLVWYFILCRLCLAFLAAQVRLKMSQKLRLFIDKILSLFFSQVSKLYRRLETSLPLLLPYWIPTDFISDESRSYSWNLVHCPYCIRNKQLLTSECIFLCMQTQKTYSK